MTGGEHTDASRVVLRVERSEDEVDATMCVSFTEQRLLVEFRADHANGHMSWTTDRDLDFPGLGENRLRQLREAIDFRLEWADDRGFVSRWRAKSGGGRP